MKNKYVTTHINTLNVNPISDSVNFISSNTPKEPSKIQQPPKGTCLSR